MLYLLSSYVHKERVSKINKIKDNLDPIGKDQLNMLLKVPYFNVLNNDLKFFNSINKFLFVDETFKLSLIGIILVFLTLLFPVSMITGIYDELFISLILKFTAMFIFLHAAYNFTLYIDTKVPFETILEITAHSGKEHSFKNLTTVINANIDKHHGSILRTGVSSYDSVIISQIVDLLASAQNFKGLFLIISKCHDTEDDGLVSAATQALSFYTDITEENPYSLIKDDWPASLKAFYLKSLM